MPSHSSTTIDSHRFQLSSSPYVRCFWSLAFSCSVETGKEPKISDSCTFFKLSGSIRLFAKPGFWFGRSCWVWLLFHLCCSVLSMLWRCWQGNRKGIRLVKILLRQSPEAWSLDVFRLTLNNLAKIGRLRHKNRKSRSVWCIAVSVSSVDWLQQRASLSLSVLMATFQVNLV